MNNHKLHNTVYARLDAIAGAEKITRKELGFLSREALEYVVDTDDIDLVNRLLGVLTPVNRKVAILYFSQFLPWEVEKDKDGVFQRFGKRIKGERKLKAKLEAIAEWLKDEANNLWSWSEDNIEVKKKDFKATIARAVKKALQGDQKSDTPALTKAEVMQAVLDGGVTLDDILAVLEPSPVLEMEAA